jgi:RNA polymerase sigma-70 factor, ECF subfamily
MPSVSQQRVTDLLVQWSHGDDAALAELTPLVYEELRHLAHRHMGGERTNHTLQTTALVNEAYLRLVDQTNPRWQNRAHFFAMAAGAMRRILVSYARSQRTQKRGGGALKMQLDEAALVSPEESKEIVDLHEALERLATLDSRKAQVVELKYFGGLNYDEIAEVLNVSAVTARRDWRFAKAWLYTELHNVDNRNDEAPAFARLRRGRRMTNGLTRLNR